PVRPSRESWQPTSNVFRPRRPDRAAAMAPPANRWLNLTRGSANDPLRAGDSDDGADRRRSNCNAGGIARAVPPLSDESTASGGNDRVPRPLVTLENQPPGQVANHPCLRN